MPRTKVLVVEDTDTDARLVKAHLRGRGTFEVTTVARLAAACEALQYGVADCVILDLNLPDSSGLTTFTSLHSRFPSTPVVILSGNDDEELAASAVAEGAQDYIPKSDVDSPVLIRAVQYAIERNARQLAERRNLVIERDLAAARQVQQHLLDIEPPRIKGFDIAGVCRPADATGGDFFDFIPVRGGMDGLLGVVESQREHLEGTATAWDLVIADVSSHGYGPALIMVGTRRLLRTCAPLSEDLGEILTVANRAVSEDTLMGQFVSLFYARLNHTTSTLSYSAAGHPSWIISANGDVSMLKSSRGLPLGVLPDSVYSVDDTVVLHSGDILLLMTDGAWEATSPKDEQFGQQRILDLIHQRRERTATEICGELLSEVVRFCEPNVPEDDVTVVLVKVD